MGNGTGTGRMGDGDGRRSIEDDPDFVRLRVEARLNDGIAPVPFLGTTWRERGEEYWWRRVGAVGLMLAVTAVVGVMAVGFAIGLAEAPDSRPLGLGIATLYGATLFPGLYVGFRLVSRAPLDDRGGGPGAGAPAGCLAFVIAPIALGVCLAVLGSMFGRDFMGERKAREITEWLRDSDRAVRPPQHGQRARHGR